jgi:NTP pyrophosphatase (non-canonical NTP hydrolase)
MSDENFKGVRPVLAWFANEMEKKLGVNDHKSGWEGMTYPQLIRRLRQELGELERAIAKGKPGVIGEAADVANFAMMIADNFYDAREEQRRNREPL